MRDRVRPATSRSTSTRRSTCRAPRRARNRCRRSCWRTVSAGPRDSSPPTRRTSPTSATPCWPGRRRASAGRPARSTSTAPTGRSATRSACVDWLAARPEMRRDGDGDPRVGVVGGSYGGALALMLAGQDSRVDAIVPMITWNDLARAFLPESTGRDPADGVFKKQWAGLFFGSRVGRARRRAERHRGRHRQRARRADRRWRRRRTVRRRAAGADRPAVRPVRRRRVRRLPGRRHHRAARRRTALALLRRSSPASILDRIKAPTLLIQGEADSLFPLTEADANARAIAATGTPVRVAWFTGGHDGGTGPRTDRDRLNFLTAQWLDHYLKGKGAAPSRSFTYSRITGIDATNRDLVASGYSVTDYPGLASAGRTVQRQRAAAADRQPAGRHPGRRLHAAGRAARRSSAAPAWTCPGQFARFVSRAVRRPLWTSSARRRCGSGPRRRPARRCCSSSSTTMRLERHRAACPAARSRRCGSPACRRRSTTAEPVTVTLPAIVHRFEAGQRFAIVVSTSDQAYATPAEPAVYQVRRRRRPSRCPQWTATPIRQPERRSGGTCWPGCWRRRRSAVVAAVLVARAAPPAHAVAPWSRSTPTRRSSCAGCARSTPTGSWRCRR